MKQTIIAIVGDSGSGKTTLAQWISKNLGIKEVVSHTTRRMRDGEIDGREHIFSTEGKIPMKKNRLAYTVYGGHKYWVTKDDILGNGTFMTYVVDWCGVESLKKSIGDSMNIVVIYIRRSQNLIGMSIDEARMARVCEIDLMSDKSFDYEIANNGGLEEFFEKGENVILKIIERYGNE